jgi:predicted TIM-barrel fold metal-dependent hydrolase
LEHNPRTKIVWAHLGSDNIGDWDLELTRSMLEKHPNLYMSMRMVIGRVGGHGKTGNHYPLGPGMIKPGWLQLFKDFPDRIVLGGDQFFASNNTGGPATVFGKHAKTIREHSEQLLSLLPEELAKKIGYENAERIYRLR